MSGLLVTVACAHRPEPEPPRPPPLGTTHTAPPGTLPPDTQPPELREAPPEVRAFTAAVRALDEHGRRDHANVIEALRALEKALVVVAPPEADARARMRYEIDALAASPPTSRLHAQHVRTALELAVTAVRRSRPHHTRDLDRYRAAVKMFTRLVTELDPDEPLLEQHARVREAFRGAVHLLHVTVGLPSPLDETPEV